MGGSGKHWQDYYSGAHVPELPSQFALFVANEIATGDIPRPALLIDAGCGNGRDSAFFSRVGLPVLAIDRSSEAIDLCRAKVARADGIVPDDARFLVSPLEDEALWRDRVAPLVAGPVVVYARFVLHAIGVGEERCLLQHAAALLREAGGRLCIEARTTADRAAAKVTPDHYRRFIDPATLAARLGELGLTVHWQAEGRGMAKYREDDATVVRMIAAP